MKYVIAGANRHTVGRDVLLLLCEQGRHGGDGQVASFWVLPRADCACGCDMLHQGQRGHRRHQAENHQGETLTNLKQNLGLFLCILVGSHAP